MNIGDITEFGEVADIDTVNESVTFKNINKEGTTLYSQKYFQDICQFQPDQYSFASEGEGLSGEAGIIIAIMFGVVGIVSYVLMALVGYPFWMLFVGMRRIIK